MTSCLGQKPLHKIHTMNGVDPNKQICSSVIALAIQDKAWVWLHTDDAASWAGAGMGLIQEEFQQLLSKEMRKDGIANYRKWYYEHWREIRQINKASNALGLI